MFAFQNYIALCFLFNGETVNCSFTLKESSRTYSLSGMLRISEKPAPGALVDAGSVLRRQCTHKIIIYILMKLEIIKRPSYGLLNTMQRNHLKLQISRINNVSLY